MGNPAAVAIPTPPASHKRILPYYILPRADEEEEAAKPNHQHLNPKMKIKRFFYTYLGHTLMRLLAFRCVPWSPAHNLNTATSNPESRNCDGAWCLMLISPRYGGVVWDWGRRGCGLNVK